MTKALSFDDVLLVPQYSDIKSRKEIDIGNVVKYPNGFYKSTLPIISAPMDTVTEDKMSDAMYNAGGLSILHRYNTIEQQVNLVKKIKNNTFIGAAIGVTGDYFERAQELIKNNVSLLCIDVAHGHHILVKKALTKLKQEFSSAHIMAGNVATSTAFSSLSYWGADSIRVGIGGGSICSTQLQTGCGLSTLQSVINIHKNWYNEKRPLLVADGGFRTSGDIVKALAVGADFVMLGSMLAGSTETPGEIIDRPVDLTPGRLTCKKYKTYRGMASKEAQMDWKGEHSSFEGVSTTIPYKGSVKNVLSDITNGIRSGFSYCGARNLKELRQKAQPQERTHASAILGTTHIMERNG